VSYESNLSRPRHTSRPNGPSRRPDPTPTGRCDGCQKRRPSRRADLAGLEPSHRPVGSVRRTVGSARVARPLRSPLACERLKHRVQAQIGTFNPAAHSFTHLTRGVHDTGIPIGFCTELFLMPSWLFGSGSGGNGTK